MHEQADRRRFPRLRRFALAVGFCASASLALLAITAEAGEDGDREKRPSLSLRVNPSVSFSPARVFLRAELKDGPDDHEDFYCASVEWDWGDGTKSESSYDCDPYEAGTSEIRRRFATEHVFRSAGNYRVQIRLKQKDKTISTANATVQVRPGLHDGAPF